MEQLTAEAREIGVSVAHLGRNVKGKLLAAVIEGAAASADDKVEHMTASICSTFRHLPVEVNPMHACMHARTTRHTSPANAGITAGIHGIRQGCNCFETKR